MVQSVIGVCTILVVVLNITNGFQAPVRSAAHGERVRAQSVTQSSVEENVQTAGGLVDMEAYAAGYFTVMSEVPCKVCSSAEGSLPSDLVGSYFRSGPAMFSAGSLPPPRTSIIQPKQPPLPDGQDEDRMVTHPFEGDGAVLALTFNDAHSVTARFRFVRTNAFTNERKKGKRLYSGMDYTRSSDKGQPNDFPVPLYKHHLMSGLNKKRKNTSNTRSVYWSKKLLTLWEGGLPYKLDSLALSTEGRSQLGGVLKEKDPFGAKAAYDANTDRMLFYSNKQDASSSVLTLYEFNSKFRLVSDGYGMVSDNEGGKVEVKMPGLALISDFAVTENYAIFVQPPVATNGMQFLMSKDPAKSCVLESKSALLHLVNRVSSKNNPGQTKTITIPYDNISDADLQFCNAYETNDSNTIIFDVIRSDASNIKSTSTSYPWSTTLSDYASTASKKSLWRYTIVNGNTVSKECLSNDQLVFGVINPAYSGKQHTYIYATVGALQEKVAPPQGITKINTQDKTSQVWLPKQYEFCGEPMYAPKTNADGTTTTASTSEDDGYILSILFNGKTKLSSLLVFNAQDITTGPIAKVDLGVGIPHGYHGCFTSNPESNWSYEEIERRAKLSDKMEGRGNMWNEVKSDFSGLGLRLDDIEEVLGDIF